MEAIARGENRILLVMATGTGKTYTAFQIIWRLWKSGAKKRILFLVDRNILADQTKTNDFKPFGQAMTKITNRTVDKAFEIYLCLYQAVTGTEEEQNIYKQFSPDFFDLVIVDECHRGSAADDAAWRKVLEYFSSATQIGLTATPKETKDVSNIEYFGEPDLHLLPAAGHRRRLPRALQGRPHRPRQGPRRLATGGRADRQVRPAHRGPRIQRHATTTATSSSKSAPTLVAAKVTEFLKATDRFAKTIVFCENIDHAERMRQALVNANPDLAAANSKYVMRITGDNDEGKAQLDNFIDPESTYPVIAMHLPAHVHRRRCPDLPPHRARQAHQLHDRVQADHRPRHPHQRGLQQALLHHHGFPAGHRPLRRPGLRRRPGADLRARPDRVRPSRPTMIRRQGMARSEPRTATPIPFGGDRDSPGPAARATTWTTSRSASSPSASSTSMRTASSSPNRSRDYSRKTVRKAYASLDAFLTVWNDAERKQAILEELAAKGVFLDELAEQVGRDYDAFDLVCHVAFDQPPLTRQERAEKVKKRNVFGKYGDKARAVLDALLQKYADSGITSVESLEILKVDPLTAFGTPVEIVKLFGGKTAYLAAIRELETALYQKAA